ncbi:MAG: hypothetical protein ACKVU1_07520 [bacterium]
MSPRSDLATLIVLVASLIAIDVVSEAAPSRTLIRESAEPLRTPAQQPTSGPCQLVPNTNGSAANYRWYNTCSGYIWIYHDMGDEAVGVLFGGSEQPEVAGGNVVKRAITYFRDTGYGYTVDVYLDVDNEGDGCPDYTLASDLSLNPGLRWNCSNFNIEIPCEVECVLLRIKPNPGNGQPGDIYYGIPSLATDGGRPVGCPFEAPNKSFYYGVDMETCVPWIGPDGSFDNFLCWLVVDSSEPCPPNATAAGSWGAIKGLYR